MTWYPESFTQVPMTDMNMRADPSRGYPGRTYRFYTGDKVYEFGEGLSYTNYTYKILSAPKILSISHSSKADSFRRIVLLQQRKLPRSDYISIDEVKSCKSLKFNVKISVKNSGDMDGSHVVMLFVRVPKVIRGTAEKQLIGFNRVYTSSRRFTKTTLVVDPCEHLSVVDEHGKRVLPLGDHVLMLGDLVHSIAIKTY